jgi:hypothetical protein
MKQETQLKPGARVRLTGWSEQSKEKYTVHSIWQHEGRRFPKSVTVKSDNEGWFFCLDGWGLSHFTYEILTDGSNGE